MTHNHVSCGDRWVSLPMELLLRVLALLDDQVLMTTRLVCRDWRQASLAFMTHLNLNAWLWNTGLGASTASLQALAKCCSILPNLSSLALQISSLDEAPLLSLRHCSSALKRLRIHFLFPRSSPEILRSLSLSPGPLAAAMAPIAHLTGLTLFSAYVPSGRSGVLHTAWISTSNLMLAQCTRLCKVSLCICEAKEWLLLLPLLAGLPHLRLLGELPLCDLEVIAGVTFLSQLTFVHGTDAGSEGMHLQLLLQLPALSALHLKCENYRNWPALVPAAAHMAHLVHFAIELLCFGDSPEYFDIGPVLAPMSCLTSLEMLDHSREDLAALPQYLWQSCFGNLQSLRWTHADVCGGGVALPLSLCQLELELAYWDGSEMPDLVQGVAALTRLTALSLSLVHPDAYGWTVDSRANATWRTAGFLTGLTRLVHWDLDHFLHARNVEGDVECLAVLTGLRSLRLHGSCGCHGGAEDIQDGGNGWRVWDCGFEEFKGRGGFLQLLPLAVVKIMEVEGPWKLLKGSTLEEEVNALRRVVGRPFLKFDYISRSGGLRPGMEDDGF